MAVLPGLSLPASGVMQRNMHLNAFVDIYCQKNGNQAAMPDHWQTGAQMSG